MKQVKSCLIDRKKKETFRSKGESDKALSVHHCAVYLYCLFET